ncbi:uncharacterized protein PFL1_01359 [Pseudozyma flocculosa PF-1]|uniref:Uncharacterized protein n=1 Tax=Pseudozyma flocculosa TaxID=84751 RepID=A0A5C3EXK1_9BASI|nr:uncharacterized protein PFL1_01359 [Pseudozyma flocculosa PF-1]EPQ31171.1 hypothetical protein PFL1_01359 [Pseudozyma flocculosa PF-1]SPO36336.1 uncharacterized protein PSFLO_01807 [Pseudozyma flocculosa]
MAGGDYHPYKVDPALDRWQNMHSTMYQRFKFTPAKTRAILLWGATVPVLTYYLAAYSDARWDLRGKTRDDSLLRKPPAAPAKEKSDE